VRAPALFEGDDLRAARLLEHLGRDRRSCDRRIAERQAVAADDQDLAELDDLAGLAFDSGNLQHVIGDNAILLAACFDDREHRFHPRVRYPVLKARRPRTGLLAVGLWLFCRPPQWP